MEGGFFEKSPSQTLPKNGFMCLYEQSERRNYHHSALKISPYMPLNGENVGRRIFQKNPQLGGQSPTPSRKTDYSLICIIRKGGAAIAPL